MASYIEVMSNGTAQISLPAASRIGRTDVAGSGFQVKPGTPVQIPKEYLFGNDSLIDAIIREQTAGRVFAREDGNMVSNEDLAAYKSAGLVAAFDFLKNWVSSGLVFAVGSTPSVVAGPYNADYTAGRALVDSLPGDFAAGTDWNYLGNGIDLAGAAAAAIADGNSVEVAFVLFVDTTGPTVTLAAVFGNEVLTGVESLVNDAQVDAALRAAGLNYGGKFIRIAEVGLARAGAVLTETWRGGEGAQAAYFNRAPSV